MRSLLISTKNSFSWNSSWRSSNRFRSKESLSFPKELERPSYRCNWGSISWTSRTKLVTTNRHLQADLQVGIRQSHQELSEIPSKSKSAWMAIPQGRALLAPPRWVTQPIMLLKIWIKEVLTRVRSLRIPNSWMWRQWGQSTHSSHRHQRCKCTITQLNRKGAGSKQPRSDKIKYSTQAVTAWYRSCRSPFWGLENHLWSYDQQSDWILLTTLILLVISSITIKAQ